MYNKQRKYKTGLSINQSTEGETIETKVERILNNKEPITDGAPEIYTERENGIQPAYNIRTDRWEIAVDAMDKVDGSYKAKREEKAKTKEAKIIELKQEIDGGAESTQGTN